MTLEHYEGYMGQGMSYYSILEIIDSFPTTEKEIDEALKEVDPEDLKIDLTHKIMKRLNK